MPVSPISQALKSGIIIGSCAFCWKMMGEKSLTRAERVISALVCGVCGAGGFFEAVKHANLAVNPPPVVNQVQQAQQAPAVRPDPIQRQIPQDRVQRVGPDAIQGPQGQVPPWGGLPQNNPAPRLGRMQRPRQLGPGPRRPQLQIEGPNRGGQGPGFVTLANHTDGEDGTIFYSDYRRRFVDISSRSKAQEELKRSKDDQEFCEAMGYFDFEV